MGRAFLREPLWDGLVINRVGLIESDQASRVAVASEHPHTHSRADTGLGAKRDPGTTNPTDLSQKNPEG